MCLCTTPKACYGAHLAKKSGCYLGMWLVEQSCAYAVLLRAIFRKPATTRTWWKKVARRAVMCLCTTAQSNTPKACHDTHLVKKNDSKSFTLYSSNNNTGPVGSQPAKKSKTNKMENLFRKFFFKILSANSFSESLTSMYYTPCIRSMSFWKASALRILRKKIQYNYPSKAP